MYRAGDIERYPGPKRSLPSRGWSVQLQDIPPTTAQHHDVAVLELENYLWIKDIHGSVAVQHSGSNAIIAYHFQPHPWIVWPVWWLNGSRCMNGSSSSPSQRAFSFSWKGSSSAKSGILLKLTARPCSATNENNIATSNKETRSTYLKDDVRKKSFASHTGVLWNCVADSKDHQSARRTS